MKLNHGLHLAYGTNIHRGETWEETFESLHTHTLAVRERVTAGRAFAIGLRLSHRAEVELSDPFKLTAFRRWLDAHDCYVCTLNGSPYGHFHGSRIKEQVYAPDWTTPERLAYTNRLFDLLAKLLPAGMEGCVTTIPGSFKELVREPGQEKRIRQQLWTCVRHIELLRRRSGLRLSLALEPEPLGYLETSDELVHFFGQLEHDYPNDDRIRDHLGVNFNTCHAAVAFEEPAAVFSKFQTHGIKISKIELSSALRATPGRAACAALGELADDVWLHQLVAREAGGNLKHHRDLPEALPAVSDTDAEWRVHFHTPPATPPEAWFSTTTDHVQATLEVLKTQPALCPHLELEPANWNLLPAAVRPSSVVDQLVEEYRWLLDHAMADTRRALRLIRQRASDWNLKADRIGIMGFSAGGELAALAAMASDSGDPVAADPVDRQSSRPDFQVLIYPGSSKRFTVAPGMPPVFIACGADDRPDISEGMAALYLQYKTAKVPAELHIYSHTGHGFGYRPGNLTPAGAWPVRLREWLGHEGFLK